MHRTVNYGSGTSGLGSNYGGGTAQGFAEIGYKYYLDHGTIIEPFGNAAYVNMRTQSFKEHGATGLGALNGAARDSGVTFSTVGAKVSSVFEVGHYTLIPHGTFGYRHAFGMKRQDTREMLAGVGTGSMDISGVPLASDSAVFDIGLSAVLTDRIDIGISYIGQYGVNGAGGHNGSGRYGRSFSSDNGAKGHFKVKF